MKQISQFYTLFWIIYFPTCIAYNDLNGFSSIDEMLTVFLIVYTLLKKGNLYTNSEPWSEYALFWKILLAYVIYSLFLQVNVTASVFYDLIQQIRPWSVIYCTWILAPRFSMEQKKLILIVMLVTLVSFIFYHPEMTEFGSEYRNAPFGQLAICTSMSWYLFTPETRMNRRIVVFIAIVGILGFKFKYYGQFGAWMYMLFYLKKKFRFGSGQIYWQIALLIFIILLMGWERFDAYYIEGASDDELARPKMNRAAWYILWDYFPFGAGFGTFATAASAVYYSPLYYKYGLSQVWGLGNYGEIAFHCDSFLATFAQIGFVGIFLFIIFWKRRLLQFHKIEDMRYYKVGVMAFLCVAIEWFGDSSFLSGKGMGYMMLMGICLNANRNMSQNENVIEQDNAQVVLEEVESV